MWQISDILEGQEKISHEEIKSKLHACYHSAHSLSALLLSRRNVEIEIYKTTNFQLVSMGVNLGPSP
jgi:hypothetical protein